MSRMCSWHIKDIKTVWVQVHLAALGRAWLCSGRRLLPGILAGALQLLMSSTRCTLIPLSESSWNVQPPPAQLKQPEMHPGGATNVPQPLTSTQTPGSLRSAWTGILEPLHQAGLCSYGFNPFSITDIT